MKTIVTLLGLSFAAISCCVAQVQPDTSALLSQSIQLHLWGGLSAAYCPSISEHSSLRFTLEPYGRYNEETSGSRDSANYTSSRRSADDNSSSIARIYRIGLSAEYLQDFCSIHSLEVFCSIGPSVSYQWQHDEYSRKLTGTLYGVSNYTSEALIKTWGVGLKGGIGCEYKLFPIFSIIAEYRMSAMRTWNRYENSQVAFDAPSVMTHVSHDEAWQIDLMDLRAGLAFRF